MSTRRVIRTNNGTPYLIAVVVIVVAFLLLGGWPWLKGVMYRNGLMEMGSFNWPLILICVGIGFILGFLALRRRW